MFFTHSLKYKAIFLSVILLALFTSITPALAGEKPELKNPSGKWQIFTNPSKDFKILLPPNVKTGWNSAEQTKRDKKDGIERYQSSGVRYDFFLSLVPVSLESFEEAQKQVRDSLKKEGYSNFSAPKDVSGNNWRAKVFDMEMDGLKFTCLTGMDNDDAELFMVLTTLPFDDPQFKKVTESLYIDSNKAREKEHERKMALFKSFFSPKSIPEFIGIVIVCIGILAFIAGGLWFWVEAFKVHLGWAIAVFVIPFAGLVFVCMHPRKGLPPFLIHIVGIILFILGYALAPKA